MSSFLKLSSASLSIIRKHELRSSRDNEINLATVARAISSLGTDKLPLISCGTCTITSLNHRSYLTFWVNVYLVQPRPSSLGRNLLLIPEALYCMLDEIVFNLHLHICLSTPPVKFHPRLHTNPFSVDLEKFPWALLLEEVKTRAESIFPGIESKLHLSRHKVARWKSPSTALVIAICFARKSFYDGWWRQSAARKLDFSFFVGGIQACSFRWMVGSEIFLN